MSAGVALPSTWGCMPYVPRFIHGSFPIKDICRLIFVIIFSILGQM